MSILSQLGRAGRVSVEDRRQNLSAVLEIGNALRRAKESSLRAFAVEVRRRARIRISVNRVNPKGFMNDRYPVTLAEDIEFDVREDRVEFRVGERLPYAQVEDQMPSEETLMVGQPAMRFYWYRIQKPMRVRAPRFVRRTGKGFFTKSLVGGLDDFERIVDRAVAREARRLARGR